MSEDAAALIVGVTRELFAGERRVAVTPVGVEALLKAGLHVLVEPGAGLEAGIPDEEYSRQNATLAADRADVLNRADVLLQVRALGANSDAGRAESASLSAGKCLIAMCDSLSEAEAFREIAGTQVTVFALEMVPRITRAQSMDVLSAMATVAGYKAVLLAAGTLPRMFPMMMTAAGTIMPARVFIMGVGVAGLQAIATARRLGAVVRAYDVRSVVKEQVESVGGKFVEVELETGESETAGGYAKEMGDEFLRKQREVMTKVVAESDVVITTAAIPGRKSPILVTADMVGQMRPGSVIVDLAAERGGNCELTQPDETVVSDGVTILGPTNLPATIPFHASEMFSRTITTFLLNMVKEGRLQFDTDDEIVRETMITHEGHVVNARIRELLEMGPLPDESKPDDPEPSAAIQPIGESQPNEAAEEQPVEEQPASEQTKESE